MPRVVTDRVREAPDAEAVTSGGRSLTYGELWAASGEVAHRLAAHGATAGTRIGVCLDRPAELVGDEKEAATPRLVSTALACGIGDILAGLTPPGLTPPGLTPPGLHRAAAEPQAVRRWLTALEGHGITCAFRRS
ncbi:hypothetical protein DP939_36260 [Spongiactinospora rosea]|uniref:AMP-dependent synthetase/ligase domain-containing protein n=1 Tax=Spongiactinospora rosea TaxID=2248750 RepID=A0A366LMZ7_9ACTN|nr:AMP-binding protein [Spongiactinospora rosea]RBQ15298.1 hypothetical protein DP939_36260 [Spongiactinospora rosea]